MRVIMKYWDALIAIAISFCVAKWAAVDIWDTVSTEIITFFGIQSAAVLPAMIFAAGLLKPDGGSLEEIRRYKKALRAQMTFWVVLLSLDFFTVLTIIVGKTLSWNLIITVPGISISPIDLSWVLSGAVALLAVLAGLRTIPLIRGILSLFELNSTMTEKVALDRYAAKAKDIVADEGAKPYKKPKDYGRISQRH